MTMKQWQSAVHERPGIMGRTWARHAGSLVISIAKMQHALNRYALKDVTVKIGVLEFGFTDGDALTIGKD